MNVENPSTSKFKLVTETLIPHKCVACNRPSDGKVQFVDFGLSLDMDDPLYVGVPNEALGVIYICIDCTKEMATLIGAMPPAMTLDFMEKFEDTEKALQAKEEENERLRTLNQSYVNVLRSLDAVSDSDDEVEESSDSSSERSTNIFARTE